MKVLMTIANFCFAMENLGRYFEEKKPFYLFAGLMFAAASGIYGYLAERDGEIEIKFGKDPAIWNEDDD